MEAAENDLQLTAAEICPRIAAMEKGNPPARIIPGNGSLSIIIMLGLLQDLHPSKGT